MQIGSCVDLSFCWFTFDTGTFSLLQNMLLIVKDKLSSSLSSSSGLRTTKQQCAYISCLAKLGMPNGA